MNTRYVAVPIAALGMLLALSACPVEVNGPMTGKYLFEVEYENYAWTYQQDGIVINASGEAWYYDVAGNSTSDWTADAGEPGELIPAAVLARKYAHGATLLEVVPAVELERHRQRITSASLGNVSGPDWRMADAGRCQFRAYYYREDSNSYELVLLHQSGDAFRFNDSPAAAILTEWLYEIAGPVTNCTPPDLE